jgi:hypothetical protein
LSSGCPPLKCFSLFLTSNLSISEQECFDPLAYLDSQPRGKHKGHRYREANRDQPFPAGYRDHFGNRKSATNKKPKKASQSRLPAKPSSSSSAPGWPSVPPSFPANSKKRPEPPLTDLREAKKPRDLRTYGYMWDGLELGDGGQRRDRTADAGLFRAALYH